MKKKKGFTLIELMIVLAIIAILAVVIIPKSGIFKNQSKNAGITTNVNTTRAYLETKITDASGTNSYVTAADLVTALKNSFGLSTNETAAPYYLKPNGTSANEEVIVNPFDKNVSSVLIITNNTHIDNASATTGTTAVIANKGKVIIEVCLSSGSVTGYLVYGIDNSGSATQIFKIK